MSIKVLMYGWEFPPLISGGLGVACYAIVTELAKRNININLVLPQSIDNFCLEHVRLIGCENLTVADKQKIKGVKIKYLAITTYLSPYVSDKDFKKLLNNEVLQEFFVLLANMKVSTELKSIAMASIDAQMSDARITGKYGANLLVEVFRYALVAGGLANTVKHDVIHAHDWLTMLAALEAKHYSRKPVVLHIHALETDRSGLWVDNRIFAIEKYGMEQADQIIAVSQYTKNNIVQHYGINPDKIIVVHNGVYFNNDPPQASTNNTRPKMVLFLGRMTHQKGAYFFIEIAKRVLEKHRNVQFVLAGSGNLMIDMIQRVASLRIGKNVHFTGFLNVDQVRDIYKLADVYIMPSVSEPFGLSALEAVSYNVPVIISKQSGAAEVLKHALVSDFWDVEDMSAKVLSLLEQPALRQASIANGNKAAQDITWSQTAEKIIKVYQKLCK